MDAILKADGETFSALASSEADRIQGILEDGEREGIRYAMIAGVKHWGDADDRRLLRERAVTILRRAADGDSRFNAFSDEDLLAEIKRRGISQD